MIQTIRFDNFKQGAVLSLPADELPLEASPRLYNARFAPQAGGGFGIEKRPGLAYIASHGSNTQCVGLAPYHYLVSGGLVSYLVGVDSSGVINKIENPTSSVITQTGVTASGTSWRFTQAKNRLYGCSGSEELMIYRTDGSSTLVAVPWGFTVPGAPGGSATGGGSSAYGTYHVAVTWANTTLDMESSRTDDSSYLALTVATNDEITINQPGSVPTHATHWNIYVRRTNSMSEFYRDADMQLPVATTTTTVSFTLTRLNAMVTKAPQVNANDPPPSGLIDSAWHLSRMFVTDGSLLYYSNTDQPDQFNPLSFEGINWEDGEKITSLLSFDTTTLLIYKSRSMYVLNGDSPQNWRLEHLTTPYGCTGPGGSVLANGAAYAWSHSGPTRWRPGNPVEVLFNETVQPLARAGVLTLEGSTPKVIYDPNEHRVLFTIPTTGSAARWTVMPFSTIHDCWESIGWDLPSVGGWCLYAGVNSEQQIHFGTTSGAVVSLARTYHTDAAQNSTGASLHYAVSTSTSSAHVAIASTASIPSRTYFPSKLVVLDSTTMTTHQSAYTVSTSTTQTIFVLTTPMGAACGSNSIVTVDMPVLEVDTAAWRGPTERCRFLKAWVDIASPSDTKHLVGTFVDGATSPTTAWVANIAKRQVYEYESAGSSISGSIDLFKRFISKRGLTCRIRVLAYYPVRWALTALGLTAAVQGDAR